MADFLSDPSTFRSYAQEVWHALLRGHSLEREEWQRCHHGIVWLLWLPAAGLLPLFALLMSRQLPLGFVGGGGLAALLVYWWVNETVQVDLHQEKERAETASRAKSQFLANTNHEIRIPMNGVLSMAELLSHTPLTEKQRRMGSGPTSWGMSIDSARS